MRSYNPTDEYDQEESARLLAEPWQLELLKLNPSYVHWGPREDYMWNEKDGWNSRVLLGTWPEFQFGLDDYNECVNFYFSVGRESKSCETCGGSGYHPDAQWVSESFYGHSSPFRRPTFQEMQAKALMDSFGGQRRESVVCGFPSLEILDKYGAEFRLFCEALRDGDGEWSNKITDDEAAVLVAEGRGYRATTAEQFNEAQKAGGMGGHDAINRSILVRARCERFGIPKDCNACDGHGYVYTAEAAHLSLTLWILHPRKGCSRGVEVAKLTQADLPGVFAYLREAADRNAQRFAAVPVAND